MRHLTWVDTDLELPPEGVPIVGVILNKFVNAPWRWSGPFICLRERAHGGHDRYGDYQRPDRWMLLTEPELPARSMPIASEYNIHQ
jgi:hypothetical protein